MKKNNLLVLEFPMVINTLNVHYFPLNVHVQTLPQKTAVLKCLETTFVIIQ